ncbi:hypothetical protein DITRI_Ditri17bG0132100 [Diplodiscus trichospermus]
MEDKKRISEVNESISVGSQKRAREDDGGEETTVTDEEVEEFYEILRRIHVAVNYFKKAYGDTRNLTELRKAEWLNLGSDVELNGGEEEEEEEEDNVGLDLNADPDTGSDPF